MNNRKFGRKPRIFNDKVPHYSKLSLGRDTPVLPPAVDYTVGLPDTGLGMYGNDVLGDCTCAAVYHAKQVWSFNSTAIIDTEDDQDAIRLYENACGYKPSDPNPDDGGVEQDVLTYWVKTGVPTGNDGTGLDNLAAFVEVNPKNMYDVKRAIMESGLVYIGFEIPAFFDDTAPVWDVDPTGDNTITDGHCVIVTGYDDNTSMYTLISWGQKYKMTYDFFQKFVDEAYALASKQWVKATGFTPAGLTLAQLEAEMSGIITTDVASRQKRRKHRRQKKQRGQKTVKVTYTVL